jgi:hypothetical protein
MRPLFIFSLLALLTSVRVAAQPAPANPHALPAPVQLSRTFAPAQFDAKRLQGHVDYLASDALEGRLTGSPGTAKAAEYLSKELRKLGFVPLPGQASYANRFDFVSDVEVVWDSTTVYLMPGAKDDAVQLRDGGFVPTGYSSNGDLQGEVVFAGYGISVPGGYDSYAGLDVTDKIVVVLRHLPVGVSPAQRQELSRYADARYKAAVAKQKGAKALVILTDEWFTPGADSRVRVERSGSVAGIPVIQLSKAALVENLTDTLRLHRAIAALDTATRSVPGFALAPFMIELHVRLRTRRASDANVVAMLPPAPGTPTEYIMIGAHYDHLGHGHSGSLARTDAERSAIHNGADDNASGVATVLELARTLAAEKGRQRGLIVAFWSGEELGLIGSTHFATSPPLPLSTVSAYVNFDMVGRLRDSKLSVQGLGSSAQWRPLVQAALAAQPSLVPQFTDDPYLPTDVTAFYPKGVPVLAFFTGSHDDYHRPTDDAPTINYPGMQQVAAAAASTIWPLLTREQTPVYQKVEQALSARGGVMGTRISVGTIPDYSYEVGDGMKLAGVRGGSAADKAGLKGGDILVEFAGQKVGSVQDYMVAMSGCKPAVAVKAVVRREGQRLELSITPDAARQQ